MYIVSLARVLYKIATSGILEFGDYKITVITELCVDSKECNQGIIIDNYSIVVHTNRAVVEKLLTSIKELVRKI